MVNGLENLVSAGWSRYGGFHTSAGTYNYYNASIFEARFAGPSAQTPVGAPIVHSMDGIHQADFLGNFTIDEAKLAVAQGKPFAVHVTPTMVHWGTCVGPCAGDKCYAPTDPHFEWHIKGWNGSSSISFPCDPCPTHRHAQTFASLAVPHVPSWNATVTGGSSGYIESTPYLSPQQAYRQDLCFRNRSSSAVDLDDMLGVIISGLQDMGVIDNTFLIFTSDSEYHQAALVAAVLS
jgi:hypothetical protein